MSAFARKTFDAAAYAAHRPSYPAALYREIDAYFRAGPLLGKQGLLVDIGCGPGVSTFDLPDVVPVTEVVGIDPGQRMVETATRLAQERSKNKASFRFAQGSVESLGQIVRPGTVDLLTAGQAAHWFDWSKAWPEIAAALKPGGTFALFNYGELFFRHQPSLTRSFSDFMHGPIGGYWEQPGRSLTEALLDPVSFPGGSPWDLSTFKRIKFDQLDSRQIEPLRVPGMPDAHGAEPTEHRDVAMLHLWSLKDIEAYLRTASAVNKYKEDNAESEAAQDLDVVGRFVKALEQQIESEGINYDQENKFAVGWATALLLGRKALQ